MVSNISDIYEDDSTAGQVMEEDAALTRAQVNDVIEGLASDDELQHEASVQTEETDSAPAKEEEVMTVPKSTKRYPMTQMEFEMIQSFPLHMQPNIFLDEETRTWYADEPFNVFKGTPDPDIKPLISQR